MDADRGSHSVNAVLSTAARSVALCARACGMRGGTDSLLPSGGIQNFQIPMAEAVMTNLVLDDWSGYDDLRPSPTGGVHMHVYVIAPFPALQLCGFMIVLNK